MGNFRPFKRRFWLKVSEKHPKYHFGPNLTFDSWHFCYLVILVPKKLNLVPSETKWYEHCIFGSHLSLKTCLPRGLSLIVTVVRITTSHYNFHYIQMALKLWCLSSYCRNSRFLSKSGCICSLSSLSSLADKATTPSLGILRMGQRGTSLLLKFRKRACSVIC